MHGRLPGSAITCSKISLLSIDICSCTGALVVVLCSDRAWFVSWLCWLSIRTRLVLITNLIHTHQSLNLTNNINNTLQFTQQSIFRIYAYNLSRRPSPKFRIYSNRQELRVEVFSHIQFPGTQKGENTNKKNWGKYK